MKMLLNIGGFLNRSMELFPDKTSIIYENQRISFRELNAQSNRIGNALLSWGVRKGEKIGLLFYNSPEFVEIFLGAVKIGVTSVPLNFRLVGRELDYIINNSDIRVLFLGEDFIEKILGIRKSLKNVEHYFVSGQSIPASMQSFRTFVDEATDEEPGVLVDEEDVAAIVYTSGTTGRPKGAVITHKNIIWSAVSYIIDKDLKISDVALVVSPLFHVAGLGNLLTNIFLGSTIVLHRQFSPVAVMETIEKEKVTIIPTMAPTMYNILLQLPDLMLYDISSIRAVMSGAATIPVETKQSIQKLFANAKIQDTYGLTETTAGATTLKSDYVISKASSVGKPLFSLKARIVNEKGEDVKPGEVGEIILSGPTVMKEYYNDPEATKDALRDGWLYSGDLGRVDEEGFIYVVDRKKDMITSGGENIYPKEIEEVLYTHPKILEAAVIGVPDKKWGESVKAVVVLKSGEEMSEEEVIEFSKANLASYKKPRSVVFISTLPKTASGKILKQILRQSYSS
jgi:fatty-acyl-CoA synthase